jgi:hypothetical protein
LARTDPARLGLGALGFLDFVHDAPLFQLGQCDGVDVDDLSCGVRDAGGIGP